MRCIFSMDGIQNQPLVVVDLLFVHLYVLFSKFYRSSIFASYSSCNSLLELDVIGWTPPAKTGVCVSVIYSNFPSLFPITARNVYDICYLGSEMDRTRD